MLDFAVRAAALRRTDLVAVRAWQDVLLDPAYRSVSPLVDWAGVQSDEQRVLREARSPAGGRRNPMSRSARS